MPWTNLGRSRLSFATGLIWERIEEIKATNVAVLVIEQNTRETLRYAQWAYVLVLGRNRLEGPGRELLEMRRS